MTRRTPVGEILKRRYELLAVLGEGALGRTYLAADRVRGGRKVAVKELLPSRMKRWKDFDLFHRECATLRSLSHRGIPTYEEDFTLHGDDDAPPRLFLVQELIRGRSLRAMLDDGEVFDEERVRDIMRQLLEIVHYLHTRTPPVIHRDIKPENVMVTGAGEVKLIDFGAVREAITAEGIGSTVVGTFGYMPPEQYAGKSVAATDLFAIGATCVELLTRQEPASLFEGIHTFGIPTDLPVTLGFEHILHRLTEGDLSRRYSSTREVLRDLNAGFLMIPRESITGALPIPLELPPPPRRAPDFHLRDAHLGLSHLTLLLITVLFAVMTLVFPIVVIWTGQLGWLALALFFGFGSFAMMGPVSRAARRDLDIYRRGHYALGEVTGRFLSDTSISYLTYRYRVGGRFYTGALATRDHAYSSLNKGDPLGVIYLADDPEAHIMYAVPADWARHHAIPDRARRRLLTHTPDALPTATTEP